MNADGFKNARMRSGISNPEIWERAIVLTPDQNKAYASGRTAVPPDVALRVNKLLEHIFLEAKQLHLLLSGFLPSVVVHFDEETLTITIERATGKPLVLRNRGLDSMNGWCLFTTDDAHPLTFLRVPEKYWSRVPSTFHWTLWRGPFKENSGRMQSYPNPIDADLLQEVLASAK